MTKILIIDDHPSFIAGVSLLLRSILPDAELSTALNGESALSYINKEIDVDWIFLDINLPDYNG